ncbi:hypothetical protein AK812_SmicGene5173 [Symbiodinium microadriaticum]|uniref:Uncharacterized protein n=1 Tax=Symbiodinium microadriaticum TaxID=2951 RepID=A0A1Q9EUE3_SYMMI|nr:hypothetical protein AK812_SmicGene5173 [Symbiodinium microadriaticum]
MDTTREVEGVYEQDTTREVEGVYEQDTTREVEGVYEQGWYIGYFLTASPVAEDAEKEQPPALDEELYDDCSLQDRRRDYRELALEADQLSSQLWPG